MMKYNEKQIKNLKATAITSLLNGTGGFHLHADGTVDFIEGSITFTENEIQAEMNRIQTIYNNEEYARNRVLAYPSIQDQLDMQYHDKVNGTSTWQDAIAKVKSDFPKA
jgi:uncharacterized protein (DUF1330 family)